MLTSVMTFGDRIINDKKLENTSSSRIDATNRESSRRGINSTEIRCCNEPLQLSNHGILRRGEREHLNEFDADVANNSHVDAAGVVVAADSLRHPLEAEDGVGVLAESQRVGLAHEAPDGLGGASCGVEDVQLLSVECGGAETGVHLGARTSDEAAGRRDGAFARVESEGI